jgi:hypothetical protein
MAQPQETKRQIAKTKAELDPNSILSLNSALSSKYRVKASLPSFRNSNCPAE